jgi:hypothetical protein
MILFRVGGDHELSRQINPPPIQPVIQITLGELGNSSTTAGLARRHLTVSSLILGRGTRVAGVR